MAMSAADADVDKELAAARLLLTDVLAVQLDLGTPHARAIRSTRADTLREYRFAAGSVGPKVEAAARFAGATGRPGQIGALEEAAAVAAGRRGTEIPPGRAPILFYERSRSGFHDADCCHP